MSVYVEILWAAISHGRHLGLAVGTFGRTMYEVIGLVIVCCTVGFGPSFGSPPQSPPGWLPRVTEPFHLSKQINWSSESKPTENSKGERFKIKKNKKTIKETTHRPTHPPSRGEREVEKQPSLIPERSFFNSLLLLLLILLLLLPLNYIYYTNIQTYI
jgi:hypothetical protein